MRLRAGELKAPVRGLIEITNRSDGGSFRRPVRVAELLNPATRNQSHQDVMLPLFDPVVLRIDEHGVMSIAGIELESSQAGSRVAEHHQVWRCMPVIINNGP